MEVDQEGNGKGDIEDAVNRPITEAGRLALIENVSEAWSRM